MSSKNGYDIMNDIEHTLIRTKDTGVFTRIHQKYCIDSNYILRKTNLLHSPGWLKIIDEPIVNCSDAVLDKKKVKEIKVNIDSNTGIVTIYNSGIGIPNKIHKKGSKFLGRKIHTPEMVFTQFRAGSNLKINANHDSGGINGIGVKLTNVHSDWLNLETVNKKMIYKQKYQMDLEKKKLIISTPVIEDYDGESYTKLEFLPHYERFGYQSPPSKEEMTDLIDIIRYRVLHLAVFIKRKNVDVYFNNDLVNVKGTQDLMKAIEPDSGIDLINIRSKIDKTDNKAERYMDYTVKVRTGKFVTTSVVNGIVVLDGTHITHLTRAINLKIKDLLKDKDKKIDCKNYLSVVASCRLPVTEWGNQSKDRVEIPESNLKDYTFTDSILTKISKEIIEKTKVIDVKKIISKNKVDKKSVYDKYISAKKKTNNNTLFIAEGDSAMLLLKRILAMGDSNYTSDNTGIFSLGGVPSNIAKGITEDKDEEGDIVEIASEKFYETKVFGALVQCLKIDPSKNYKTKEELKILTYNKIVICVDADLDGIGNIASLVLQVFYRLWPHLYKHNYIKIWNSPILRITNSSGKVVKEFKFEQEFTKWKNEGNLSKDHKIAYIKGLAGHSDKYIRMMSKNFDNDIINIKTGEQTKNQFDIYFGKDSNSRKHILSTPVIDFTEEEINEMNIGDQSLLCDRHLDKNTKEFQLYAMKRTIPGLDNFTPVRRKSFTSFYKHNQTSPLKVYMAAGRIAYEYQYHHGDASIHGAIIKMCQDYPGSNVIPLLLKDGQVGSRDCKGKDSGSARYVGASLNKSISDVLFPKDDIPILPKQYIDGSEVEPNYYLPTLPLPILEFHKSVSYAWCLEVYPRDIKAVCDVMKKLCKGEDITDKDKKLPLSKKNFDGKLKFKKEDGIEKVYTKGLYEHYVENKVDILHITELPLVSNPKKIGSIILEDEDIVSNVLNHTTDKKYQ